MKKVFLFGALGALGCLVAWGLGEVFLKFAVPWANALEGVSAPSILTPPEPPQLSATEKPKIATQLAVATPAPPPSPPPFHIAKAEEPPPNAEFAQRLARAGAHKGDVEVALFWFTLTDLDLHVVDPAGEEIYYKHKTARSGGQLDVDMNVKPTTTKPAEHVYFPVGRARVGHYKVYVACYTDRAEAPNNYVVEVKANGKRRVFRGFISEKGRNSKQTGFTQDKHIEQLVYEFDVEPPKPELQLSVPENVSVIPDGSNDFRIRIARAEFDDPVTLRLDSGHGLSIDAAEIPRRETVKTVTLRASIAATAGQRSSRLTASAETAHGHVEASANLLVTVVQPPEIAPVLKIAVPKAAQVLEGESNRFKVRVGRYFFPTPAPVILKMETPGSELTGNQTIVPPGDDEGVLEIKAPMHAPSGKHTVRIVASTTSPPLHIADSVSIDVVPRPLPSFGWAMVAVVGLWTVLLAIGLSLLLVAGQNRYLGRQLLSFKQVGLLLLGGAVAGGIAGGGGQMLLAWLGRMQAAGLVGIRPEIGQVAGWCLLGILLGYGVAFFIPNLSGLRAAAAGGFGALVGVGGFLALTHFAGEIAGRVAGATTLGFAIGTMVAIAEVAFREAWLEIRYGPNEVRTVSLGREPVSLGSDQDACTVYAANAVPIAYRYWLKDNAIFCEDVPTQRTSKVFPGDSKQVGNLVATVFAVGKVEQSASAAPTRKRTRDGFFLHLNDGRSIKLSSGATLGESDLPGLHSEPPGGPIAVVNPHPTDPSIQGLQNLSQVSWRAHLANGDSIEVKPGKNVRIAAGTRVNFGSAEGEIYQ